MAGGLERQRERAKRAATKRPTAAKEPAAPARPDRHTRFDVQPPSSQEVVVHSARGSSGRRTEKGEKEQPSRGHKRAREGSEEGNERPPTRQRSGKETAHTPAESQVGIAAAEQDQVAPLNVSWAPPSITYQEGFSYTNKGCHGAAAKGMLHLAPHADRKRARDFFRSSGGTSATNTVLVKMLDVSLDCI